MLSGTANRFFGRKPVLISAAFIFTIGAIIMGLASGFNVLLLGRCVVGLAVGLASSTVPLYLAELAPPRLRGFLVSVNNSCIVIGQVSAAIVDGLFSGNRETGWRWMLGLGGVPSVIQLIGLLFLPESPRWLLSRGEEGRARKVLMLLRATAEAAPGGSSSNNSRRHGGGAGGGPTITSTSGPPSSGLAASASGEPSVDLQVIVDAEVEEILASLALEGHSVNASPAMGSEAPAGSSNAETAATSPSAAQPRPPPAGVTLADLWAVRRQLTLGVGLLVLQQMIGINTIMYYSVSILLQAHIGTVQESIWLAVPVAAAQLVGCVLGGLLIDRVGRRPLVLASLVGVSLSLAAEGGAFLLEADGGLCSNASATNANISTPSLLSAADAPTAVAGGSIVASLCAIKGWLTVGGMIIYLLCFGVGMSPVPWAINAEIYPMPVRAQCVGIATACNWIMNFIVAASFLSLQDLLGKAGAFWLYGGVAVLGTAWLCVAMPETSGRSLEQIEQLFRGRSAPVTAPALAPAPAPAPPSLPRPQQPAAEEKI